MREKMPRLTVSNEGDVRIVEFNDKKILDEIAITQISDQLLALIAEADPCKIVIDFSSVAHMSSSALGTLITAHKRIRERGGLMRLCCIQPTIYEVFAITRLSEIFQICHTRLEAIDSLS